MTSGENSLLTSLPLSSTEDPAVFHHRLFDLIDQLKLLSVTGRIASEELSPFYLLNLLEETLTLSFPALLEYCRSRRGDKDSILTAEENATDWNRLVVLRLLSLQHWQLMPTNLPVEKLSTVIERLLDRLPEPLGRALQEIKPDPGETLPDNSAVVFHHLLLRLQQIGWLSQKDRGEKLLRLLLTTWHKEDRQHSQPQDRQRLLFHSQALAPRCHCEISHSGAQLAANTLWRVLDNSPHPLQQQGDAFLFSSPFHEKSLHANLSGSQRPETALRRELAGRLRTSWPNRHLTIPGNLPFWSIEAAHLLGLTAQNSRVELHLPANWLSQLEGTFFSELLFTNFIFESVDGREHTRHLLSLCRRHGEVLTEIFLADGQRYALELGQDHPQAAYRLLYALELPPPLFQLFTEQQLVPLAGNSEETMLPEALRCYAASSLGQQLWQLRSQTLLPATTAGLLREGEKIGWLVPGATHLKELGRLSARQGKTAPAEQELDSILAQLLGIPPEISIGVPDDAAENADNRTKPVDRNLGEQLLRQLEVEGIPRFPQTYLYRQTTGPLKNYLFAPPLKLHQELLGQYEFIDAAGQLLQVTGEETKEALLLASSLGLTSLEIPLDRQQTAEMLDNYRQDLLKLQEKMTRLCHRHIEQLAAAQRLHNKLWQLLPLPPLKWLSG